MLHSEIAKSVHRQILDKRQTNRFQQLLILFMRCVGNASHPDKTLTGKTVPFKGPGSWSGWSGLLGWDGGMVGLGWDGRDGRDDRGGRDGMRWSGMVWDGLGWSGWPGRSMVCNGRDGGMVWHPIHRLCHAPFHPVDFAQAPVHLLDFTQVLLHRVKPQFEFTIP